MSVIFFSSFYPSLFLCSFTGLKVKSKAFCEHHRHTDSLLKFLAPSLWHDFPLLLLLLLSPSSFPPSHVLIPWLFPDRPKANVHQMPPPPPLSVPRPVTAHYCVRYRQMELLSVLAPLFASASRLPHSKHCLFCLPLSYPLPSEK